MSKGKYDSNDETNEILNCSGKIKVYSLTVDR
jgi:hypothetical protein